MMVFHIRSGCVGVVAGSVVAIRLKVHPLAERLTLINGKNLLEVYRCKGKKVRKWPILLTIVGNLWESQSGLRIFGYRKVTGEGTGRESLFGRKTPSTRDF